MRVGTGRDWALAPRRRCLVVRQAHLEPVTSVIRRAAGPCGGGHAPRTSDRCHSRRGAIPATEIWLPENMRASITFFCPPRNCPLGKLGRALRVSFAQGVDQLVVEVQKTRARASAGKARDERCARVAPSDR